MLCFAEEESRRRQFAKNYPTLIAASLQEKFNSNQGFLRRKKTGLDLIGKQMKKIEADWQEPLLNPETR